MKRNLSALPENANLMIRGWLASKYAASKCPWVRMSSCKYEGYDYCRAIFPTLPFGPCPCSIFKLAYVRKVAKEVLKKLEESKGG